MGLRGDLRVVWISHGEKSGSFDCFWPGFQWQAFLAMGNHAHWESPGGVYGDSEVEPPGGTIKSLVDSPHNNKHVDNVHACCHPPCGAI